MAFEAENIRDWLGKKIVDPTGSKIGDMEAVYYDTATDTPVFATVELGMFNRKRLAFVPLSGATVHPDHVKVTVTRRPREGGPGDRHRRGATRGGRAGDLLALRARLRAPYRSPAGPAVSS